jgi:hypothetical protein
LADLASQIRARVSSPPCLYNQYLKIPAAQFRLLLIQVVQYILSGSIDYDEVAKVIEASPLEGGHSDTKGAVSALHFALSNSAKYDVEDTTLLLEIQQLGLPKVLDSQIVHSSRQPPNSCFIGPEKGKRRRSCRRLSRVQRRVEEEI